MKECLQALKQLSPTLQRRVMRSAVTAAAKPIIASARATIQANDEETGTLRKSMGSTVKTYRKTGSVVVVIGPRVGFANAETGRDATRYAHLVEDGHKPNTPPHPFLRPAFDSQVSAARDAMEAKIWQGIEDIANKGGK